MRTVSASELRAEPHDHLVPADRAQDTSLPVLVLDFDGTVCLGDGPIWAYANGVLPALDADRARGLTDGLAAYLAGDTEPGDFSDGYSAVVRLAGPEVSPAVFDRAYHASRVALASGAVDVHTPDGLPGLLASLAPRVRRVLLTNAPDTGMDGLLDRLGLAAEIDEVITSAAKPDGFDRILPALLDGDDPAMLLSVGDLWVNDISRPLEAGCATAYVDRTGADPRPAHAKARTLPELYPAIRAWAADPVCFVATHPSGHPSTQPAADESDRDPAHNPRRDPAHNPRRDPAHNPRRDPAHNPASNNAPNNAHRSTLPTPSPRSEP